MKIVIDKEMTANQLARVFHEAYPFLKIEIYHQGDEMSFDVFHTLNEISSIKKGEEFMVVSDMTIEQIEYLFWEKLGLQIAIFRKVGNSWLHTAFTNNWTLHRQNQMGKNIFGAIA